MQKYSLLTILMAAAVVGITVQAFMVHWFIGMGAALVLGLSAIRTAIVVKYVASIGVLRSANSVGIFVRVTAWTCCLMIAASVLAVGFIVSICSLIFGIAAAFGVSGGETEFDPALLVVGGFVGSGVLYAIMTLLHRIDDRMLHNIFRGVAVQVSGQTVVPKSDPFA